MELLDQLREHIRMCLNVLFVHSGPINLDVGSKQSFGVIMVENWRSVLIVRVGFDCLLHNRNFNFISTLFSTIDHMLTNHFQ
jgi:hypothetical protein